MSETVESLIVDCPAESAATYVGEFFAKHVTPEGSVLTLCVPVGDATVNRDVLATLTPAAASAGGRAMGLRWMPKGGGPYPDFAGTLELEARPGASSLLTIRGTYGPPGGVAGVAFDVLLGRRMAVASLKALLATLKAAIEAAREESATGAASYLPTYE